MGDFLHYNQKLKDVGQEHRRITFQWMNEVSWRQKAHILNLGGKEILATAADPPTRLHLYGYLLQPFPGLPGVCAAPWNNIALDSCQGKFTASFSNIVVVQIEETDSVQRRFGLGVVMAECAFAY